MSQPADTNDNDQDESQLIDALIGFTSTAAHSSASPAAASSTTIPNRAKEGAHNNTWNIISNARSVVALSVSMSNSTHTATLSISANTISVNESASALPSGIIPHPVAPGIMPFSFPPPFQASSSSVGESAHSDSESAASQFCKTFAVDSSRIAASERTLQFAQLWPKDQSMQQLLLEVIRISENCQTFGPRGLLTAPAAVSLAGCGVRMATYLIGCSTGTSSHSLNLDVFTLFGNLRQTTVTNFEEGGWNAIVSLPRSILDRWWSIARKRQPPIPASFDCEVEQAVCGAFVVEWIRLLIQCMNSTNRQHSSSPLSLLTLDLVLMPGGYPPPTVLPGDIFDTFSRLQCEFHPELSELKLLETIQLGPGPAAKLGYWQFCSSVEDRQQHVSAEDAAAMLILDSDSWYHHPSSVHQVTEQMVRGEFQTHVTSNVMNRLRVRAKRVEGSLIRYLTPGFCKLSENLSGISASRVHLLVTDASQRDWELTLQFDHEKRDGWLRHGNLRLATISLRNDMQFETIASKNSLGDHNIWSHFSPNLSAKQHQILDLLNQVHDMKRSYWQDERESAAQLINRDSDPIKQTVVATFGTQPQTASSVPTCSFSSADTFSRKCEAKVEGHNHPIVREWCEHAFEQIAFQMQPLTEFHRWGLSRYEDMHTLEARRRFQACMIDASMKASCMPLLPSVIVDLIAEYHALESRPYIAPEQQKLLANAEHQRM